MGSLAKLARCAWCGAGMFVSCEGEVSFAVCRDCLVARARSEDDDDGEDVGIDYHLVAIRKSCPTCAGLGYTLHPVQIHIRPRS